jgi:uncharacterized membrane protein
LQLRYKIVAYVLAWIVALLLTAPGLWPLAYMFPLGLIAVFDRHFANNCGWSVFIGLYVLYIVHAFFYFRSKTNLQTAILFALLVVLLTGNVTGCREMIHSH